MRETFYACPFCNRKFKYKYSAIKAVCPNCGNELQINWLTNGKQECGLVDTTLVCFWGANGSVELPNNVIKIGTGVFENRPRLTKVILPESLQEIGKNAFYFCFRLQNIELPKSLKIIGKRAFNFTGIQKLYIPRAVELIEEDAFDSCPLIKEIAVHKDNQNYHVNNDALIDTRTGKIIVSCCKNKIFYKFSIAPNAEREKTKSFKITNFGDFDKKRIMQALTDIERGSNKFIICEADTPINNITYLQAISEGNEIRVEFHLQKSPDDTAWENWSCNCNYNKCLNYFFSFLRGEFVPDFNEWDLSFKEN